jgi:ADP-dependent NAD(P)H-hydrate dehydratase / NAD(P)H-hydrate epimerase
LTQKERPLELPAEIYATDSVRRIDRNAIEMAGIDGYTLMNRAAAAALNTALDELPHARRWQIVCGGGNNGGDGYVLARLARQRGIAVAVIALTAPEELASDAATAHADFAAAGGAIGGGDREGLDPAADLLVDAILGTGLRRKVEGRFAEAIDAINAHPAPVLALDLPSGLSSDTGKILGAAVRADRTITFVALKAGLFLAAAADCTGALSFAGLDIPDGCRDGERPVMRRIGRHLVRRHLPPRPRSAHKGDFGHLLVVGGGAGMPGAIRLCGEGALRAGAGRVTVATHPSNRVAVMAGRPELMCHGIDGRSELAPLLERATCVAIGPGLGTDAWASGLLDEVLGRDLPAVLDADALNLLAKSPSRRGRWILTPHPGEAGRLLQQPAAAVQDDRLDALSALQRRFGGTAVLKGAGTLVSSASGPPWICTAGNSGMASPGMGDVLTGVIAGLLAQGLGPEEAAAVGVEVHANAGDDAARDRPRGLLASDLLGRLRAWINP